MKTTLNIMLIALSVFAISCKKEGCTDVDATNYDSEAKKDDGTCTYPDPVDPRDQYLGTYTVLDSAFGSGGSIFVSQSTYPLVISKNTSNSDGLKLLNIWDSGHTFDATLSGTTFIIPSQAIPGGDPNPMNGNGTFSSNQITFVTHSGSGGNFLHEGAGSK